MKQFQIEFLRDFATDHLPRAQADREQVRRFGGDAADLNNRLAVTATMVRSKAGTTAIEFAAANVLESVTLLCADRVEVPISKPQRASVLKTLASNAQELCMLTGTAIPWLTSLPTAPEEEEEEEPAPAPATQKTRLLAGRLLTTKEAAEVLGYAEQTLRKWASDESGPIQPIRNMGRHLRWSGDDILVLQSRKKP